MLTRFLALCLLIVVVDACKCRVLTVQEAFKNAQWVSRSKILQKDKKTDNDIDHIEYKVEYVNIFKMKHHLTQFLAFCLLIVALDACKCGNLSPKEAYKNAQWVTRVKILRRQGKKIDGIGYIEYKVNHIDVFKNLHKPRKLSDEITTLATSEACGLPSLEIGKEYLLSGRFVERDNLRMYACEQIIVKIKDGKPLGVVLEWNEVPNDLRKKLNSGNV